MKDVVEYEVMKNLNWKERVIVKIFAKTFNKVYNLARIETFNKLLQ